MKKTIFSLSAITLTFAVLAGCSSKEVVQPPLPPMEPMFSQHCEYATGIRAPEWYCNPNIEGGMAAVGEAKTNAANDKNMQRAMAMASGRDALARQAQIKVQNLLTNWTRATGANDDQTYEANFENVSRQIAQQTLQGSRQLNRWVAPDGTLALLVGMSDSAGIKNSVKTSLRNEQALWQQFQSKQALEELDKQLEEAFR